MNIEFIKKQLEAFNIYSFWWSKPPAFKHTAGEYIELSLDVDKPDERGNRHWYTVAASPTEKEFMFTTKFPASGQRTSAFKQYLLQMKPGTKGLISPPMGDFVLPKDKSQPLVFVAGGIGVTPFRSMAKYIKDENLKYPVQLLYTANSSKEFAFTDLLDDVYEVARIVSEAEPGWDGPVGRLDAGKIKELAGGLENKLVYISGPEPMVKSLRDQLIKAGHPKHLVKIDDFPGYTDI